MAAFKQQKDFLIHHVNNIECIDDLVPFLKHIGLDFMRNVVKDQINKMDARITRNTYYNALPMDCILPIDTIQHSLSFIESYESNTVCQTFKECNVRNEAIKERERMSVVDEQEFTPKIKHNPSINRTWIVHPTKKQLSNKEIECGYLLENDFIEAVRCSTSGDKLLVHGQYEIDDDALRIYKKDIQIIGIGDDVVVKFIDGFDEVGVDGKANVYIKNIKFDNHLFAIYDHSTLWMEECQMANKQVTGIHVGDNGNLYIKQCDFSYEGPRSDPAIAMFPSAGNVRVIGSMFRDYNCPITERRHSCIVIDTVDWGERERGKVSLECIGNIFKNNMGYPITEKTASFDGNAEELEFCSVVDLSRLVLEHNVLERHNIVKDPNKLYYSSDNNR